MKARCLAQGLKFKRAGEEQGELSDSRLPVGPPEVSRYADKIEEGKEGRVELQTDPPLNVGRNVRVTVGLSEGPLPAAPAELAGVSPGLSGPTRYVSV